MRKSIIDHLPSITKDGVSLGISAGDHKAVITQASYNQAERSVDVTFAVKSDEYPGGAESTIPFIFDPEDAQRLTKKQRSLVDPDMFRMRMIYDISTATTTELPAYFDHKTIISWSKKLLGKEFMFHIEVDPLRFAFRSLDTID